jgi:mannobiose 2-epimerase
MISTPSKPDRLATSLRHYADRIETDLLANVLPFWLKHAPAADYPAFIGELSNDLVPNPFAQRGMLLTARLLWTFSAAHRRHERPEHLAMADRAYRDLQANFRDNAHGGYWWALRADGRIAQDHKQVYGQAFALYALAEYHLATGRREILDEAVALFELLQTRAHDHRHGGYIEAFDRTWRPIADMRLSDADLNAPKSQNTHLHLLEAYTALFRLWPDVRLGRALRDLVLVMSGRITDPASGHLRLFFSREWTPIGEAISPGHDIEASWLLTDAAGALSDATLFAQVRTWVVRIADATLAEGGDSDGGLFNQTGPAGVTDPRKEWWPQAEAVVGFINAAELSGEARHWEAAMRSWDFIEQRLIDRRHGEWFRGVTRDGAVLREHPKISFWKCPYHNGRAALEATRRLRAKAAALSP